MKKSVIIMVLCAICSLCAICASGCISIKDYGEPSTKNYPIRGSYTALEARYGFQVTVSDQVTDAVITVGELAHDKVRVEVHEHRPRTENEQPQHGQIPHPQSLRG